MFDKRLFIVRLTKLSGGKRPDQYKISFSFHTKLSCLALKPAEQNYGGGYCYDKIT